MSQKIFLVQGELNHTPVKWGEAVTLTEAEAIACRETGDQNPLFINGAKVWGDLRYGTFAEVVEVDCGCPAEGRSFMK